MIKGIKIQTEKGVRESRKRRRRRKKKMEDPVSENSEKKIKTVWKDWSKENLQTEENVRESRDKGYTSDTYLN